MSNLENCLKLGSSAIGSKISNMGKEVFDKLTLSLKQTPEAEHLLIATEDHLKKNYREIYDGTMQGLSTFPPHYDLGVEKKRMTRQKRVSGQDRQEGQCNMLTSH